MDFMTPKAILFDLDGTLLDRPTSLERFLPRQYQRFETLHSFIAFEEFRERFLHLDQNGYVWKDRVYQQLEDEFNLPSNSWSTLLADYIENFCHDCVAFSYTHELLSSLLERGYKLGMITNGYTDFQLQNISTLQLNTYFHTILVSEEEGIKKPDPRLFQKALKKMNVNAGESFFIGDHEEKDVGGAQACGLKTVRIDHSRTVSKSAADHLAYSCEEILHLFSGNTVHGG